MYGNPWKGGVSIRPFFGPRQNRSKLWYFLPTDVAHNLLEPFAVRAFDEQKKSGNAAPLAHSKRELSFSFTQS